MKKIDPIGSRTAELQWEMQTRNLLKATADSMRLHCWSQIQKHALAAEFADGHQSWASLRMKEFAQKPITYFLLQHANWKLSNFVMFSVLLLFPLFTVAFVLQKNLYYLKIILYCFRLFPTCS
jgi:hypothetical protein